MLWTCEQRCQTFIFFYDLYIRQIGLLAEFIPERIQIEFRNPGFRTILFLSRTIPSVSSYSGRYRFSHHPVIRSSICYLLALISKIDIFDKQSLPRTRIESCNSIFRSHSSRDNLSRGLCAIRRIPIHLLSAGRSWVHSACDNVRSNYDTAQTTICLVRGMGV